MNNDELLQAYSALINGENDFIARSAQLCALLFEHLPDVNWVGFYFYKQQQLVLGPFQGRVACTRIPVGKGVCGTAFSTKKTLIVDDVNQFDGHIACDSQSVSEIVVPLIKDNDVIGVLDIDSPKTARFNQQDAEFFEAIVKTLLG